MSESYIAENLKKLMFERNLTPTSLARKLDVPQQTIQKIVAGKSLTPRQKTVNLIASYFSVEPSDLLSSKDILISPHNTLRQVKTKEIPVNSWGNLKDLKSLKTKNSDSVTISNCYSDEVFAVKMNDDSMSLQFAKDTILILDPVKAPLHRSFVLVKLHQPNTYIFRQILLDGDKKFLKPLDLDLIDQGLYELNQNDLIIACLAESRQIY